MTAPDTPSQPTRLLTFRSGGWVLLLTVVVCGALVGWWAWGILGPQSRRAVGDGKNLASYHYNLTPLLVDSALLVPSGLPQDGLPPLIEPQAFTPAEAEEFTAELRRAHLGKFLVGPDRVIGVVVNGAARAYPLKILNWHEIVNDTLGGEPILVTYSPLCDSVAVFSRRVGEETPTFGHSGLLFNSNLVLYDRQSDPNAISLWSQLEFRAIAGPAAGQGAELQLLPAVVVPWSAWQTRYPETTVLAPERERLKLYKQDYSHYFAAGKLHFPVQPLPDAAQRPLMTPMLALRVAGGAWHTFALGDIQSNATAGVWRTTIDGVDVQCTCTNTPLTVWPTWDASADVDAVQSFWFAWYATHPAP